MSQIDPLDTESVDTGAAAPPPTPLRRDPSGTPVALHTDAALTVDELQGLLTSREFLRILRQRDIDVARVKTALRYERDLRALQVELVKMQRWVEETGTRLAIVSRAVTLRGRAARSAGSRSTSTPVRCASSHCRNRPTRKSVSGTSSGT